MAIEEIVLGGGCFWCLEAIFQQAKGVLAVESGYAGGARPNPTYEQVCSGHSGHAEVVKLRFDTDLFARQDLLRVFFTLHDPTTLNRQGNDVGTQYRSVIFYQSEAQKHDAELIMQEMQSVWQAPIVTQLLPLPDYFKAEAYHQNYFVQHPGQGYCAAVVAPKVQKFRSKFAHFLA
ncbi:MAG: peptide-methionine (S)-S-oxide reductase [Pseudomonadota bacterium]